VASTAVIQVKPGIGDVIWHLPFIRAIAAVSPGGQVAFLAPPRSAAQELLAAEPAVAEVVYFEHSGSELRRAVNWLRLAALLRRRQFQEIWILDRTVRPASAARLAGIPRRIGLGLGRQQRFITNAGIDARHFHDEPIEWLAALMAAMSVPLASLEPGLRLPAAALAAVDARHADKPRPWIALGIAASHPDKDWPERHWTELIAGLGARAAGTIFLIGGPDNRRQAENLVACSTAANLVVACDLPLIEAAALLRRADLFVGANSGPLNLAAAGGTPAFGLFGNTPVLTYSKFIHAIVPEGGPAADGMARITPVQVLEQIAPYLAGRIA
jgi:heptosyltransferase II